MPLTGPALGALRILLVEDSPEDAELMSEQMLDAGLEARFERVESEVELRQALQAICIPANEQNLDRLARVLAAGAP
ncbi:hypothetical protein ACW4FQ_25270 [Escherichia coli]